VIFVNPQLVAEVEYRRWPEGGQIQQASFKGIRTDKTAREVVKEGQGCSPIVR
jgi:bifunctional non-homologous end joining protein LigD